MSYEEEEKGSNLEEINTNKSKKNKVPLPSKEDKSNLPSSKLNIAEGIEPPIEKDGYKIITLQYHLEKDKKFKEKGIKILEQSNYRAAYKDVSYMNLNDGNIEDLKIKDYYSLVILKAANSNISKVELNLKNLNRLDLSCNYINKLFNLENLPNLRDLNLSQNCLKTIKYIDFQSVKFTLTKLNISDNLISFNESWEFFDFLETFGPYMKELKNLQIYKNPFIEKSMYKEDYENCIKYHFGTLQVLDSTTVSQADQLKDIKFLKGTLPDDYDYKKIKDKIKVQEKIMKQKADENIGNQRKAATLEDVLLLLESFGGQINDKKHDELENCIEVYVNTCSQQSTIEAKDKYNDNEVEIFEEIIKKFREILGDKTKKYYEKKIFILLGNFAIIKQGKFAKKTLEFFREHVTINNYYKLEDVFVSIQNYLDKSKEDEIPVVIIDSLKIFLDFSVLTKSMIKFLEIILKIGTKIEQKITYNSKKMKDTIFLRLFRSVTSFVADSLNFVDLLNVVVGNEKFLLLVVAELKKIFMSDASENSLHIQIYLLYIVRTLVLLEKKEKDRYDKAQKNPEEEKVENDENKSIENIKQSSKEEIYHTIDKQAYSKFKVEISNSGLRGRIETNISLLLQSVTERPEHIVTELEKQKRNNNLLRYSSLVKCYGALISISEDVENYLDSRTLPIKLLTILGQNDVIDPILISSSCDFAHCFLDNNIIKNDSENFEKISNFLYNCRYIMPYLNYESNEFIESCEIAEEFGEKCFENGHEINLKKLNSKIINDMFISISELICFFGKGTMKISPIMDTCKEISSEMNKLNRDNLLLNLLKLPNEQVKLTAIKCYYSTPVEELDPNEIIPLLECLKEIKEFSEKMNLFASVVFIILDKWFKYKLMNNKKKDVEDCKDAIMIAFRLLCKINPSRCGIELERKRQRELQAVLSMFLRNICCFEWTYKLFKVEKIQKEFRQIILKEEGSNQFFNLGFPLDLEKSFVGWNLNNIFYLLDSPERKMNSFNIIEDDVLSNSNEEAEDSGEEGACIVRQGNHFRLLSSGSKHSNKKDKNKKREIKATRKDEEKKNRIELTPYNYVSLRMLNHLADVLSNEPYPILCYNFEDDIEELLSKIIVVHKKIEKERINCIEIDFKTLEKRQEKKNYKYSIKINKKYLEKQYDRYNQNFELLIEFLQCRCNQEQIMKLSKTLEDKFTKNIDKIIYQINAPPSSFDSNMQKLIGNNSIVFQEEEKTPNNEETTKEDNEKSIYKKFINFMRREKFENSINLDPYDTTYNHIQNDLLRFKKYGFDLQLERKIEEETPNNLYLRSKFVSCFLRSIYSVLTKAQKKHKDDLIKIIYTGDNIKSICLLADSTKYVEDNIGSKLMLVLDLILEKSYIFYEISNKPEDVTNNLLLEKLGIISYVIRKVIRIYHKIINLDNICHVIFTLEFCRCCSKLLGILNKIPFPNEIIKQQTITTMIDYQSIEAIIDVIKVSMNKDKPTDENMSPEESKKIFMMNVMVEMNAQIIGEYMCKCPNKKYDILEKLTSAYIFDGIKMRKTVIKDIIDYSRIWATGSKLITALCNFNRESIDKSNYDDKLYSTNILFLAPAYFTSYHNKRSSYKLIAVAGLDIYFVAISNFEDAYKIDDIDLDDGLTINIKDITNIISFKYYNHILIQTKTKNYGLFFPKMIYSRYFLKNITNINKKINLFQNMPLLQNIDKDKIQAELKENEDEDDENNGKKGKQIDLNKYKESNRKEAHIFCEYIQNEACCDLFKHAIKGFEVVPNGKVMVITDDSIEFKREKFDEWEKLEVEEIFESVKQGAVNHSVFEKIFEPGDEYSIGEFNKRIKVINGKDCVLMKDKFSPGLKIGIFDDLTFKKLLEELNLTEEFKDYDE